MHPVAWMVWTACALLSGLLLRNPWYLGMLGMVALTVRWRGASDRPGPWLLRLVGGFILFSTALNFALSRAGATVLLRFPLAWIGGPYTLEALLFGVSSGVQISSVLLVMVVFSAQVSPQDLLRRIPRPLFPVGVTASVALSFAPRARRAFHALREAQEVRGHRFRGLRDMPRLVTPLVLLSLENATALAEGLVVRGWSRGGQRGWRRWSSALGWLGLAVGVVLWAVAPGRAGLAAACAALGAATLFLTLRHPGGPPRFRPETWKTVDRKSVV